MNKETKLAETPGMKIKRKIGNRNFVRGCLLKR